MANEYTKACREIPMITVTPTYCTKCKRLLNPVDIIWLAMDGTTHKYYETPEEIPQGHIDQGGFPFGKDCARVLLKGSRVIQK